MDLDPTPNTITVNVTAVNDPPSGTNKTITTLEDTGYTFSAADFGVSDPNDSPANALLAVKISSLPAAGSLTNGGAAVTAGQFISATDITAGKLKFAPAANANGSSYTSFTFQVQDNGGTANGGTDLDPTPNTITVNVTAVNDPPSGTNKIITTLEDTAYTFSAADFGFSDPNDSPAGSLVAVKITTLPAAGSLSDNGVAVSAGQFIAVADITAGKLKFAPAANANGSSYTSLTFQVQDNGGTANGGSDLDPTPNTITVNVTAVNDAPSGSDNTITTISGVAYTLKVVDFGFSDPGDSPANALQAVRIASLPGAGALTYNGAAVSIGQFVSAADIAAGKLQFTPAADAQGSNYASFTFQVQDDGGSANGGVNLDPSPNTITINAVLASSGIMGFWHFNEASGSTAHDSSGKGNDGTLQQGASFGAGQNGNGLIMGTASQSTLVPNSSSLNVTQNITIAAWIAPYTTGTQSVVQKSTGNVNGYELSLSNSGTVFVRFNQASSGNSFRLDSNSTYPTNGTTWMHVVATYDGTTIRMYINGQLEASKAAVFTINANNLGLGIGADPTGSRGMRGRIDDVLIANRALDPSEVTALYAGDFPPGIATNQPPTVSAGSDVSGQAGVAIALGGSVSDDGLPSPSNLITQWSTVSGPGSVSFGNAAAPSTSATFSAEGVYVLRLTASDGELSASDDVTVTVSPTSESTGLVGFWNFLPGFGAAYPSQIGNLGSLQGGATVSSNGRLNLNGSGQSYVVPDVPQLQIADAITITAWIKPSANGTQTIVSKAASNATDGFELGLSNSGTVFVRFNQASSGDTYRVDSTSSYPTNGNTWLHVAATYDGSTIRLYINGQQQASKAATFAIGTNNLALTFGSGNGGTTSMQGQLDEVLITDRALSATEIAQVYVGNFNPAAPANQPPTVSAGSDVSGQAGVAIALGGSVSDDGLPSPSNLITQWSTVSGPGSVSFGNAAAPSTSATFSAEGVYVLRLTASDGELSASDDVTVTVSPTSESTGLVGFWNFLPGFGAAYPSQIGNLGSLQGGATVSSNGRLNLNGSGQSYVVPDVPQLQIADAITITAWIKPSANGTQTIVSKAASNATDGFELGLSNSGTVFVRFNQASSGDTYRVDSTSSYPTNGNTWLHVAATYDGSTIRLYINGQQQASKAATFAIGTNNLALTFGSGNGGTTSMQGQLDEVLITDRALSATEIAQVYVGNFNPAAPANQPPTVSAGSDVSGQAGVAIALGGSVSDDGLPSPSNLITQWSTVSGPGSVSFGNAAAPSTSATFSAEGVYVLRLTASDGELSASDDVTVTVSPASTSTGLVGFWQFNEGSGSTVHDSSGSGNDGSLQDGAAFGAGQNGTGLVLAGSVALPQPIGTVHPHVVVPDAASLDITGSITIAAWISPEAQATQSLVTKSITQSVDGYELALSNSGTVFVRFNQDSAGNAFRVDSTSKYPTNGTTWMHVVATYDGTTIRMYINGQLEASKAANFTIGTNDLGLSIGAEEDGGRSMQGRVDDVLIANRALQPNEVAELFQGNLIVSALTASTMSIDTSDLSAAPLNSPDTTVQSLHATALLELQSAAAAPMTSEPDTVISTQKPAAVDAAIVDLSDQIDQFASPRLAPPRPSGPSGKASER